MKQLLQAPVTLFIDKLPIVCVMPYNYIFNTETVHSKRAPAFVACSLLLTYQSQDVYMLEMDFFHWLYRWLRHSRTSQSEQQIMEH